MTAPGGRRPRILLLIPTTTYRAEDFFAAAERLGVEPVLGTDRCHVLAEIWPPDATLLCHFNRPEEALAAILAAARERPFDAVLGVDDPGTELAARASAALGLRHNAPDAARTARHKRAMREALERGGVRAPRHLAATITDSPARVAREVEAAFGFPCVLKPVLMSASRGVMRADDPAGLAAAWRRLDAILKSPEHRRSRDPERWGVLVEAFVPGREVALEGLLDRGRLRLLALFDKPDPLDGPFFEETIYVTPSRLPALVQAEVAAGAARAAAAIGLREGPVHAELRLNEAGPWVIEVAGRSIGGLCSRALRFGLGEVSLEEIILRHALGMEIEPAARVDEASGVMMIPIPRAGVLKEARGIEAAEQVAGVTGIAITIRPGEHVTPLPEGSSYLGFIFARGESPAAVEASLRAAHGRLEFEIAPAAPIAPERSASAPTLSAG